MFEHFTLIQAEVSQTVRELTKAQKVYNEDEHLAHDARTKSNEVEEK